MTHPIKSASTRAAVERHPAGDNFHDMQTELPARRAFVVQLDGSSEIADGQFAGRVEHVLSGQRRRFVSLDELTAFISEAVRESEVSQ